LRSITYEDEENEEEEEEEKKRTTIRLYSVGVC